MKTSVVLDEIVNFIPNQTSNLLKLARVNKLMGDYSFGDLEMGGYFGLLIAQSIGVGYAVSQASQEPVYGIVATAVSAVISPLAKIGRY